MVTSGLRRTLSTLAGLTAAAALTLGGLAPAGTAGAAARWAPADRAAITPGTQMYTDGAQCTANFVFTDAQGRVYVGYAAHCAGKGAATDTNGCETPSYPLGTPVTFEEGGGLLTAGTVVGRGRLAYSSWLAMQRVGTTRQAVCQHNDFALVRVAPGSVDKVNPTVPHWGGPTGINTAGLNEGDSVYTYGSSGLRNGENGLSPKQGISTGDHPSGWGHYFYTSNPGVPGDSGSAILDGAGRAVGVLSTISAVPPGENTAGDLARELAFAQRHSGIPGLRLVHGTRSFSTTR